VACRPNFANHSKNHSVGRKVADPMNNYFSLAADCFRYVKKFGVRGLSIFWKTHFLKPTIIRLKLPALRNAIWLRGTYSDIITFNQTIIWNSHLWTLCKEKLADTKVECVIDCGANIGLTTVLFTNMFPDAKVVAIEPGSENFLMLQKNTNGYDKVFPVRAGVWSRKTNLEVIDQYGAGNNGLIVRETNDLDGVPAVTIQDIMNDYSVTHIDLLKVDVEGAEREIFKQGASGWLSKTKVLLIELHDYKISGSSSNFVKAVSQHSFDIYVTGEVLFCLNREQELVRDDGF
jgi:FkbM family methyltransferase